MFFSQMKSTSVPAPSLVPPTVSSKVDRRYMTLNSFSPLAVSSPYVSKLNHNKKRAEMNVYQGRPLSDGTSMSRAEQQRHSEFVENNPDYDTIRSTKRGPHVNRAYESNWREYSSRL